MYIKHIELSHFKSFGGTAPVPLLPGFTVISGPNGSGKSNILDALLFALGLSGSKGMRAERLPDLVNQNHSSRRRSTVEASVIVIFALEADDLRAIAQDPDQDISPNPSVEQNGHANGHGSASESDLSPADPEAIAPASDQNGHHNGHTNGSSAGSSAEVAIAEPVLSEWKVCRKLRVTPQGTYTSTYYINDQPCTLTELHEQLHKFRIYPEGYNVVLQGDVTSIISMNPRERRQIIDELAGVAAFDRKISQAKDKLDQVKEREDRFRIVERELMAQRDRLAEDRVKAEKYQKLRSDLQNKSQWEIVLRWRNNQRQVQTLQTELAAARQQSQERQQQLASVRTEIQQISGVLAELNQRVKALGEEEQIALQSELASREAELRQIQRQEQALMTTSQETGANLGRTQREIQEHLATLEQLTQEQQQITHQDLQQLQGQQQETEQALQQSRDAANEMAAASETGLQEQVTLRRDIETLRQELDPKRTEYTALQERQAQLHLKIQEQQGSLEAIAQELADRQTQSQQIQGIETDSVQQVQALAAALSEDEQSCQVQRETVTRLLQEQRDKQRQLDRLEAQTQAQQEAQGTRASRLILESDLPGICGLVAQLGRVDPQYQRALEIAAGGRLGCVVVEDDGIAAAAIELLKRRQAGRATFLPLNKLRSPKQQTQSKWNQPQGWIDYASNLIDCDSKYQQVFAFVFGNTVVFSTLADARAHLGKHRIVTLDGELLEPSGAMTGGSIQTRGTLHFGTVDPGESSEAIALRERLQQIEAILNRGQRAITEAEERIKTRSQSLADLRQQHREAQLRSEQLHTQLTQLSTQNSQLQIQLAQNTQAWTENQTRLEALAAELPHHEERLQSLQQTLSDMERSQTHSQWQQIQATIRTQETQLTEIQVAMRTIEHRVQDLETQKQRLQAKVEQGQIQVQEYRSQQRSQLNQRSAFTHQQTILNQQISQFRKTLADLEQTLSAEKLERDRVEKQLKDKQTTEQQLDWQIQKLQEQQQAQQEQLGILNEQLIRQQVELPDPLPEIPEELELEQLQQQLRSLQKRIQAMEPVNMLALEEYERTQERLEDLSQKLTTLEEERTELLLRIENFTTLRQQAFREAFDAVNQNFKVIFAELSDGDGHLQLEDPEDPFAGGLNLVAHPKGKPVRRLASMSGGEKSLTALSFIFALQRYRPSPFYAFDEVDMFLDGANVERLARMIEKQAQHAQFIVVSLRRPMIESSERTIGVTQARGAYTQVLGLSLPPKSATASGAAH